MSRSLLSALISRACDGGVEGFAESVVLVLSERPLHCESHSCCSAGFAAQKKALTEDISSDKTLQDAVACRLTMLGSVRVLGTGASEPRKEVSLTGDVLFGRSCRPLMGVSPPLFPGGLGPIDWLGRNLSCWRGLIAVAPDGLDRFQ